jgi:hypothetical protein
MNCFDRRSKIFNRSKRAYWFSIMVLRDSNLFCSTRSNAIADFYHPHLLYPQFKHVAHPSIMITAFVLHLWHIVAPGGKASEDSPESALPAGDSPGADFRADSPSVPARSLLSSFPERLSSGFFFEPPLLTRAS